MAEQDVHELGDGVAGESALAHKSQAGMAVRGVGVADARADLLSFVRQGVGGTGLELKVRRRKTREVLGPVSEVEAEAADGEKVELQVEEEETFKFGAIVRRDELFCRLLALGDQRWEAL